MRIIVFLTLLVFFTSCRKSSIQTEDNSPDAIAAKQTLSSIPAHVSFPGKSYFFGDSITEGLAGNSPNGETWVALVSQFAGWTGINLGKSGTFLERTSNGYAAPNNMYNRALLEIPVKTGLDRYLFFSYGTNDVSFNYPDDTPDQFAADYQYILNIAYSRGWKPKDIILLNIYYANEKLLVQAKVGSDDTGRLASFNKAIEAIVNANTGLHLIDIYSFMKTHGAGYLLSADGIHPNETGYAVIARGVEAALSTY